MTGIIVFHLHRVLLAVINYFSFFLVASTNDQKHYFLWMLNSSGVHCVLLQATGLPILHLQLTNHPVSTSGKSLKKAG